MNNLLRDLKNEHEHSLVRLGFIRDAAYRIADKGINEEDYSIIKKFIFYINVEVREHSKKEEEILFPHLEMFEGFKPMTDLMRQEHIMLWLALDRIASRINEFDNKSNKSAYSTKLYSDVMLLVGFLTDHIQKENNILFPMIERIITNNQFQTT